MITKERLTKALNRLNELLQDRNEKIELVVVGGANGRADQKSFH